MAFNFSISLTDAIGGQAGQDAVARQAMTEALTAWSNDITGIGTLIVQLNVAPLSGLLPPGYIELADAASTSQTPTGAITASGQTVEQTSAVHELVTGQHLAASDITVDVNSSILSGQFTEAQLVTVFEHELMHGFGVEGYRGSYGQLGRYATPFDTLSYVTGGSAYFTGAAASYVYGGAVPLTTGLGSGSNYYHVGTSGTASDPANLRADLIYPVSLPGQSITGLDVAILEDIGVPISYIGQAAIDPNPTSSIHEIVGNGQTSVTSAAISGTTQPGEVVLIYNGSALVATTTADANGNWQSANPGLADGTYQLTAEIYGAAGLVAVGSQYVVLDTASPLHLAYWQVIGRDATASELAAGQQQLRTGASVGNIRQYLAGTGYAASAINQIYRNVLNRAVTQPELAADEQALVINGSVGSLQQYLSTSTEAGYALGNAYAAVLGRWLTLPELTAGEAQLANYGSIANVRASVANSTEAAGKIAAVYADVAARAPSASELATVQSSLGAGGASLAGLRAYFATTAEAAGKLQSLYSSELGRTITSGELSADEQAINAGASLTGLRAYLASSAEAGKAISALYANTLSRSPAGTELASAESALAAGTSLSSLQAALAASPAGSAAVATAYRSVLGVTASADELVAGQQVLAGGSLAAVQTAALAGPEFGKTISASFQAAIGRPANDVEIAAARSELSLSPSGLNVPVTVATIQAQIAELSGGPTPNFIGSTPIGSQTIPGSPSYVSGLLNNAALISAAPENVVGFFHGTYTSAEIGGFNPATDVFQIESKQTASFSALTIASDHNAGSLITLTGGSSIDVHGVAPASLTAANVRFV